MSFVIQSFNSLKIDSMKCKPADSSQKLIIGNLDNLTATLSFIKGKIELIVMLFEKLTFKFVDHDIPISHSRELLSDFSRKCVQKFFELSVCHVVFLTQILESVFMTVVVQ